MWNTGGKRAGRIKSGRGKNKNQENKRSMLVIKTLRENKDAIGKDKDINKEENKEEENNNDDNKSNDKGKKKEVNVNFKK